MIYLDVIWRRRFISCNSSFFMENLQGKSLELQSSGQRSSGIFKSQHKYFNSSVLMLLHFKSYKFADSSAQETILCTKLCSALDNFPTSSWVTRRHFLFFNKRFCVQIGSHMGKAPYIKAWRRKCIPPPASIK